jgi:hypothetical protein
VTGVGAKSTESSEHRAESSEHRAKELRLKEKDKSMVKDTCLAFFRVASNTITQTL